MKTGMRPRMKSLWSSSAAVTPPTSALIPVPPKVCGTRSSRTRWTSSSTPASCGEPFGITVSSAALPSSLMRVGVTKATAASLRSFSARASTFAFPDGSGRSAAITSGPFDPGPKPSVLRS